MWVTHATPVVVALHPPPLSTRTPGNNDEHRRSPFSSSPSPRLLSPFPCPSSILPHRPHLLLFPFGSDVAMVALDVGGVRHMGGGGDVAWLAVLAWLGAGDVALSAIVVGVVGAGDVASVGGVVGGVWGP